MRVEYEPPLIHKPAKYAMPTPRDFPRRASTSTTTTLPPPRVTTLASRDQLTTVSPPSATTNIVDDFVVRKRMRTPHRNRRVRFQNANAPDEIPRPRVYVDSYDDLFFRVARLDHTLSAHDSANGDFNSESSASSMDTVNSDGEYIERSEALLIAEFLYRSAVYLGYPRDQNAWMPNFRDNKRFSTNDAKRWRRLAHYDWEQEDEVFEAVSPFDMSMVPPEPGSKSLRKTVSKWIHRHRSRSTKASSPPSSTVPTLSNMENPPSVPEGQDLSRLVVIANSCISYGAFRFREKDIRKLCNAACK
ncbi:hypothetical protein Poli38472_013274 [Pythium oligandrum]|uniref:Uncharacterized protein n=1 Tax=Pythium oligandrum TaxID=41045 RepID=A0A8K1C2R7_PYTOL|nr:hypothetical protein Poli38472_013274 [Pythium oligandrum]|eukprot:TMW55383.1 hypothetical protein Poli38472_013274 [Pythium oligandrum]